MSESTEKAICSFLPSEKMNPLVDSSCVLMIKYVNASINSMYTMEGIGRLASSWQWRKADLAISRCLNPMMPALDKM